MTSVIVIRSQDNLRELIFVASLQTRDEDGDGEDGKGKGKESSQFAKVCFCGKNDAVCGRTCTIISHVGAPHTAIQFIVALFTLSFSPSHSQSVSLVIGHRSGDQRVHAGRKKEQKVTTTTNVPPKK